MIKDKYCKMALPLYKDVCTKYEETLIQFSYKKFSISEYEVVYEIERDLIVYIGLKENNFDKVVNGDIGDLTPKDFHYEFFDNDISMLYYVHIEELTSNNIFKFNKTAFSNQFDTSFVRIISFQGYQKTNNLLTYVDNCFAKLNLKQRVELWSGWIYYFIVFEIVDSQNNKCFGVWYTDNKNVHIQALKKCKDIETILYRKAAEKRLNRKLSQNLNNICFDDNLESVANQIVNIDFKINKKVKHEFYNNIQYFIVEKNIKHKEYINDYVKTVQEQIVQGFYNNIEKGTYLKPIVKWKSEYLVKQLCEKLYGVDNVIYQFRPFFLHTNVGQLSYDIYLPKKKIAIEYQGKQHFESVDFFGGEENFKRQQERDLLKKRLSEENGISLIYINYWEEITEALIKNKINGR